MRDSLPAALSGSAPASDRPCLPPRVWDTTSAGIPLPRVLPPSSVHWHSRDPNPSTWDPLTVAVTQLVQAAASLGTNTPKARAAHGAGWPGEPLPGSGGAPARWRFSCRPRSAQHRRARPRAPRCSAAARCRRTPALRLLLPPRGQAEPLGSSFPREGGDTDGPPHGTGTERCSAPPEPRSQLLCQDRARPGNPMDGDLWVPLGVGPGGLHTPCPGHSPTSTLPETPEAP